MLNPYQIVIKETLLSDKMLTGHCCSFMNQKMVLPLLCDAKLSKNLLFNW